MATFYFVCGGLCGFLCFLFNLGAYMDGDLQTENDSDDAFERAILLSLFSVIFWPVITIGFVLYFFRNRISTLAISFYRFAKGKNRSL